MFSYFFVSVLSDWLRQIDGLINRANKVRCLKSLLTNSLFSLSSYPIIFLIFLCFITSINNNVIKSHIQNHTLFPLHMQLSSVQLLSRVRLFATPWITAHQASLSITNSQSSPRLVSIESVMPSSHLILGRPLLLLPPISPSFRVFSNESTLRMRWPKYWSFSFSSIPSKEIPGADLLQNGLVGSPCSPRDAQESSPTPQFKSISSSALSLLHSPTLTSIHDHRKNHSLD